MGSFALFLLAAVGVVACLAVALRAGRWRRVGDHPHCTRCDFDLFGLPAESTRCPECGAMLDARRAVAVGQRRAHRPAVALALMLAIVAVAGAVLAGRQVVWGELRMRLTPTAWLIRHLDETGPIAARARAELDRRLQADGTSDATRGRIARGLWSFKATARANVRAGDTLPITLAWGGPAAAFAWGGPPPSAAYSVWYASSLPLVNGTKLVFPTRPDDRHLYWNEIRPFGPPGGTSVPIPPGTPPGPVEVELTYHFRLIGPDERPTVIAGNGRTYRRDLDADDPATDAWTQTVRVTATVLPADAEDDVEMVTDPAQRAAVHAAIRFNGGPAARVLATRPAALRIGVEGGGRAQIGLSVDATSSPVPLAMDVLLRDPSTGREVPIASLFVIPRSGGGTGMNLSAETQRALSDWTSPTATLVLRPSKAIARSQPTMTRIWGEPIEIADVPIVVNRPATREAK